MRGGARKRIHQSNLRIFGAPSWRQGKSADLPTKFLRGSFIAVKATFLLFGPVQATTCERPANRARRRASRATLGRRRHCHGYRARAGVACMLSQAPVTFFLHISSSGGTSVCRLAQEQPCARVPSCGANCNLNCRHPWDWRHHCLAPACAPPAKACRPSHKPGCGGLRRYAARHNLTFLSSETMLLEGPCPDFAYVTVPRPAASAVLVATPHCPDLLRLTVQAPSCVTYP